MMFIAWLCGWFVGYISAVFIYSYLGTKEKKGATTSEDIVEVWKGHDTGFWWHKQAANNEVISRGESYSSMQAAMKGAFRANPEIDKISIQDPFESNRVVYRKDIN